jgi:bifunctional DNA-binding transcriptional regulator/antitoxin component of YhaV-PrlF toxin-antitoxin module
MGRNKDKTIRKLTKIGRDSYCVTLPIDYIRRFGWREKQKLQLEVDADSQKIIIRSWDF